MLRSRSSESGTLFGIFIIIKTLLAFLAATCRLVTHPGSSVIWQSSYFTNPTPSSSLMSRLNKFMYVWWVERRDRKKEWKGNDPGEKRNIHWINGRWRDIERNERKLDDSFSRYRYELFSVYIHERKKGKYKLVERTKIEG